MGYAEFHRRSIDEPDAFWAEQAALIDWKTPPAQHLRQRQPAVHALVRGRHHQPVPQRASTATWPTAPTSRR